MWERQQKETRPADDSLFRQPNGDLMAPGTFTFCFKKILRQNGLPENLNVHSLRHPYVKHTTKNIILKSRNPKLPRKLLQLGISAFVIL